MIKVYKTFEIDDNLWEQIVNGFNESFDTNVEVDDIKNGFCCKTQLGYGYHAVAFSDVDGELMGFNTYTPSLYNEGIKILVSGGVYVRKKYRKDIFISFDMMLALKQRGIEDGFQIGLGVPNHNAIDYAIKFMGATLVGYLDYYILPRNISKITHKKWLKPFDKISAIGSCFYLSSLLIISKISNSSEKKVKYSLIVDDDFYKSRFADSCYFEYRSGEYRAFYRVCDEDGIRAVYIMDFREKGVRTKRALAKATKYIMNKEKPDAVLYIGKLWLRQHILLKVPQKYVPKPLPLTYGAFRNSDQEKYKDMSDINNWDFSLMNFDVR